MSGQDFYGGARLCLDEARHASSPEEALDWLLKAMMWRDIARRARARKAAA